MADRYDFLSFGVPFIILCSALVLMYQFIYVPAKIKADAFDEKYPIKCVYQKNQTVLQLNANDQIIYRDPITVCQVSLRSYVDDNGTWQYVTAYQYESQAKYNKPFHESYLNCKPKTFDNISGNWVCVNGSIAKEYNNDY